MRASNSTLRRIMAMSSRSDGVRSGPDSRADAVASTGVSGVRNSWLRTERKSSLARLDASAASFARRNSSRACRRAVTSTVTPSNRVGVPSSA